MTTPHIAALLREREHYVRRNLPDRAAAVTTELQRLGHETTSKAPPAVPALDAPETTMLQPPPETAIPPRPRPRRSTTDE